MKRLGKVFWGVLCMMLLFAFSHASDDNICAPGIKLGPIKSKENVKFEWDASTTYVNKNPIEEQHGKVFYEVYVYNQDESEEPPKENVDNYKYDGNKTEDTSYDVILKSPGTYVLGVRAYLFKNGIEVPGGTSNVSWSCDKTRTKNNPQYVIVSE